MHLLTAQRAGASFCQACLLCLCKFSKHKLVLFSSPRFALSPGPAPFLEGLFEAGKRDAQVRGHNHYMRQKV